MDKSQPIFRQATLKAMADSFVAMGKNKEYLKEAEQLEQEFATQLPEEKDAWWK